MKRLIYFISLLLLFSSCEKNDFELSQDADEFFFLRNKGADMPVWVKGNTASKTFIVIVHGGPGGGSVGTYNCVKSFKLLQRNYAIVYWDQRAAGNTQGHYKLSTITAGQMVEDLEKLIALIQDKYGADISIFLKGASWGGYLGSAYLTKGNNQENIKGWISENGAHNILLTGQAELRKMIEFGNDFVEKNINKDAWTEVVKWCKDMDTITNVEQWFDVNAKAHQVTKDLLHSNIANFDVDMEELARQQIFGSLSNIQNTINNMMVSDSPLEKNFLELDLSDELQKVTIPSLYCVGKYDVIVPDEVSYDAYNNIGSEFKELIIYNKSGHSPSASMAEEFAEDIILFIEAHK